MAGKYKPLERYLHDLHVDQSEVTLSFRHIERILGDTLPPSAHQYQAWWANEKNPHQPQKMAIANAGWTVDSINLKDKWLRLLRK